MIPTNEERREVAERLRENAESNPRMGLLLNVAFADGSLRPEGSFEWEVSSHDAALRLADLIEPEPERACRDVYDGREFSCSECGTVSHVLLRDEAMDWRLVTPSYCPNCGAKVIHDA